MTQIKKVKILEKIIDKQFLMLKIIEEKVF
jgi:hypothetical protein